MSKLLKKSELLKILQISSTVFKKLNLEIFSHNGLFDLDEVVNYRQKNNRALIQELKLNTEYKNKEICTAFKCSTQGGMRRSHYTNTLVLFSNQMNFGKREIVYGDYWENNILYYTGMGLSGDQSIDEKQNKILANSLTNYVDVYLFETQKDANHLYRGKVMLVGEPFAVYENDQNERSRIVYKFPLELAQ